jgi:hypothetical protein
VEVGVGGGGDHCLRNLASFALLFEGVKLGVVEVLGHDLNKFGGDWN